MKKEYAVDPDTGLPELPEGFFWRVRVVPNPFAGDLFRIQIRRKWIIGSYAVQTSHTRPTMCATTEQSLRFGAGYVYEDWMGQLGDDTARRLQGDYPPKKLD